VPLRGTVALTEGLGRAGCADASLYSSSCACASVWLRWFSVPPGGDASMCCQAASGVFSVLWFRGGLRGCRAVCGAVPLRSRVPSASLTRCRCAAPWTWEPRRPLAGSVAGRPGACPGHTRYPRRAPLGGWCLTVWFGSVIGLAGGACGFLDGVGAEPGVVQLNCLGAGDGVRLGRLEDACPVCG
jgi:hypothetical protein